MATVKITADLDQRPALRKFTNIKKTMTRPIGLGKTLLKETDAFFKKFHFKSQMKEVKNLRSEFSKMSSGMEKSMKRQEVSAKIVRTRMVEAVKFPAKYAAKAYKKSEINQSAFSGMHAAHGFLSNNDQVVGGGFDSTIRYQMGMIKGVKDNLYNRYKDWKQSKADIRQQSNERGLFSSKPNQNGLSGSGHTGSGSGGTNRGGFLSSVGSGTMILEGLTKAAGFLVSMASGVAEKHTQAMMSQAGTIGATGSYVGKGGGYFANAEVAQAQVAYNRGLGNLDTGGRGEIQDKENMMKFAAEQNLGIGAAAGAMGEIQRASKDINAAFIKGAAKTSGVLGLKQGEFLTKFSHIVQQNRDQGFGEMSNAKDFLSMSAGISQQIAAPERGLDIAANLNQKGKMGENGGVFGALALVDEMNRNGGDYFAATKAVEKNGFTQDSLDYTKGVLGDENIMGYLARQEGVSSFTEGTGLYKAQGKGITADDGFQAGSLSALARENKDKEFFASAKIAPLADKLANDIQDDSHKMIETMMPLLADTIKTVSEIEKIMIPAMTKSMEVLVEFAQDVKKEGGFKEALTKSFKKALF